jgi:hypothetical protein
MYTGGGATVVGVDAAIAAASSCFRKYATITLFSPPKKSCTSGSASSFSVSLLLLALGEAVPAQST